jgi:hypothetical protein
MALITGFHGFFVYFHFRNSWKGFVVLGKITIKQVFIMDGYVEGMVVHGKYFAVPVKNGASYRFQRICRNTAIFGDAEVFIAFCDL